MTIATSPMAEIERTRDNARARLLDARVAAARGGYWVGGLSSSALSTATATAALALAARASGASGAPGLERDFGTYVSAGRAWLAVSQNEDGGYGDTIDSPSNLSTTALAWMALRLGDDAPDAADANRAAERAHRDAEAWLSRAMGRIDPERLADALANVYGDDRTFAVPILVACAAGGAFGGRDEGAAWRSIPPLPFELAALPQRLFKWLGLPVVSYALPALIAIGQAIHAKHPTRNPITRALRGLTREHTLRKLDSIQPVNGGFLEATPLTSFVVLSLIAAGRASHPVTERGLEFLRASMREDGSWPIDTNLATWVSTLAIGALDGAGEIERHLDAGERERLRGWLLGQQYRETHAYTGAAPGGWAWTDLPGGVPDADDTPGAMLALRALSGGDHRETEAAARAGATWLMGLQNRDGGIPTFCRGWGKLPFDKSCPDLTAHAMRAWSTLGASSHTERARDRAAAHLIRSQRADGAWVPLWFGNQFEARQQNPLYGTSRVLRAAGVDAAHANADWRAALERGLDWILAAQNEDGGFGGAAGLPPSIEETALGLEALADATKAGLRSIEATRPAIERAASWLVRATDGGTRFDARPIGLYFAKLWYSERLYPLIYTVSALERSAPLLAR